jgi:hypothetical protein
MNSSHTIENMHCRTTHHNETFISKYKPYYLKDFNMNNYEIEVEEIGVHFANCLVRKAEPNNKSYKVQIPLEERGDSCFGSFT